MNKSYRYTLYAVAAVVLGVLVYIYLPAARHEPLVAPRQNPVELASNEPITPIPLLINLDQRKVVLGRRLFHDPILSADRKISCATCHNLSRGGVDGLPRSIGIGGAGGDINAPTVLNSGLNFRQFWDGRAATLEEQIDGPVQNPKEMGAVWPELIVRLVQDEAYRRDFSAIYPAGIQPATVKDAIATFERSLITPNSKFDRFLRGEKDALSGDEYAGYTLFKKSGCISCHQGVNVGGNMYEKLGLVANYFESRGNVQKVDYGRYNLTGKEEHRYEFRVPSLRNVALTAPYFHDASAATLADAVAAMGTYQLGVDFKAEEIDKIVQFLHTLTGEQPEDAGK